MENVNSVVTLNQWEAAALETALEQAIEKDLLTRATGKRRCKGFAVSLSRAEQFVSKNNETAGLALRHFLQGSNQ